MLNFMWYAPDRGILTGTYEQLSRQLSCSIVEIKKVIDELNVTKVADVTICNDSVTVVNRRMLKEEKERKSTRLRVQKFRNTKETPHCNGDITVPSSSSSSTSTSKNINTIVWDAEKKDFSGITTEDMQKWREAYPALEIQEQIYKAREWVKANPKNKKSNWKRFLINWFSRAQDKAPGTGGNQNGSSGRYIRPGYQPKELSTEAERAISRAQATEREWLARKEAEKSTNGSDKHDT